MTQTPDLELLHEYVRTQSESAFSEVVRRHLDWVHTAALRQVRHQQMAEDVTQAVFIALARQAPKLCRDGRPLAPWLFQVTRYASRTALRSEGRRKHHERGAASMRTELDRALTPEQWDELAPLLDSLVARLSGKDRQVVLLRFYQRKSLTDVAQSIGVSEPAAQKRVERAVEKLRRMFQDRRLVTASSAVLALGLETYAAKAAEASLLATATQTALAASQGGAVAGHLLTLTQGALKMMTLAKMKLVALISATVLSAGVVAASGVAASGQHQPIGPAAATTAPATIAASPASADDSQASPASPADPKTVLQELTASARRMDAQGIMDCFDARTPEEQQFVQTYAQSLTAMEQFRQAMESRFGRDDRYSLMGAGNSAGLLPFDQATERITGDQGVIEVVAAPGNTISIPMKRVEGKWRLPVTEVWDVMQKMASAKGGQVPPMNAVTEAARRTAPAYRKVADAVGAGTYKSADAALGALQKEMARPQR